jgi:IclR family acetate operon transcriptional repressor
MSRKTPPRATDGDGPNYPIGSVDNALRLLRIIADRDSIRIADASREIGVARSTAHRLMQMLQHHGFIQQDPESKAYVAGPELVRIGLAVVRGVDVRSVARPWMERLVEQLEETVHLSELQGINVVFLDSVESPRALRVGARTGTILPAYCTASGKVMLADLSKEELHRRIPESRLEALTTHTVTTRRKLEQDLDGVRSVGYSTNFGESEPDVHAIAAPIRDSRGRVRAALSVSVPPSRLNAEDVPRVAAAVVETSVRIGEQLPV